MNVVGGLSIQEPALDLAIVMAIMSSYKDLGLKHRCGFVGEVGLTGEIRSIPNIEKRLKALKKLGFNTCYVPKKNSSPPHVPIKGQIAIDNIRSLLTDVKWA